MMGGGADGAEMEGGKVPGEDVADGGEVEANELVRLGAARARLLHGGQLAGEEGGPLHAGGVVQLERGHEVARRQHRPLPQPPTTHQQQR